jgi:hypothetical protein
LARGYASATAQIALRWTRTCPWITRGKTTRDLPQGEAEHPIIGTDKEIYVEISGIRG